jgi:hypothetical protein
MGDDDRVTLGLVHRALEPDRGQVVGHVRRAPLHIGVVGGIGADAGNPQQRAQALDRGLEVGVQLMEDGLER